MGTVSLSGTAALTIIAETSELQGFSNVITNLYEGVGRETEIILGSGDERTACARVLREMHLALFCRSNPTCPTDPAHFISTLDAAELLRKSLNYSIRILRESKGGLDVASFRRWAETYFQCSLLLFGQKPIH